MRVHVACSSFVSCAYPFKNIFLLLNNFNVCTDQVLLLYLYLHPAIIFVDTSLIPGAMNHAGRRRRAGRPPLHTDADCVCLCHSAHTHVRTHTSLMMYRDFACPFCQRKRLIGEREKGDDIGKSGYVLGAFRQIKTDHFPRISSVLQRSSSLNRSSLM